ncbi:MAG: ammonium transporter [Neisseriaceae bacterium]|nr:ammonium transporter [Neisseriaceae bacterium]
MRHPSFRLSALALLALPSLALSAEADWVRPYADIDSGDTAWILVSALLVLFMTLPGLALFYAGMVRKKNILATMLQSFAVAALVAVLWMVIGYSLAFTANNPFIGGLDRFMLNGLNVWQANQTLTIYPGAATIPESVFMVFQMAFAIISAAIITGAFAERIKFAALLWFTAAWLLLVYAPTAHWVWEGGGWLAKHGVLDFAGGTVVHINAGMAGLVGAILLGRRLGYGKESFAPANLSLALMGTAMLWIGWFGFNAGSAFAANAIAGMAMLNTQVAAAMGALAWLACEKIARHKPSALGFASGALSGLVGITPAAGFVGPQGALAIGALTAVACFWSVTQLKIWLRYDDALDAFGIHGIGGIVGALLTALFFNSDLSSLEASVLTQLIGVLVTVGYSAVVSLIILVLIDKTIGLRVNDQDERQGLDISLHGERIE